MEKTIVKKDKITKEQLNLMLPFVTSLNENKLKSPEDYKKAIEEFSNQEVDIELILGLKQFSCYIEEEDKKLIMQNYL